MLFTSSEFVILLLVTFIAYYLPWKTEFSERIQMLILIAASLLFYGYHEPVLVLLLLFSVTINFVSSYQIVYGAVKNRKIHAALGVILNLAILIFFKYSGLIGRTVLGGQSDFVAFLIAIPLPIGISFFTFQGISLIVDTYRNRDLPEYRSLIPKFWLHHAGNILLFKSFFPQLISGPIVKSYFFLPQIGRKLFREINWQYCFRSLVLGYFLKMVIADNLKDQTAVMTYPYFEPESSVTLLMMLFGYSMQIFADFAGYSLIALGLAGLFGYQFPVNFNFPYISTSFSEFWKRWHISLSTFLREYLYIPLGGNRSGSFRTSFNLFITMVLGGLWHGAAWSYAIWGVFHGLLLVIERFVTANFQVSSGQLIKFLKGLLVFGLVTFGWLLFKLPEFVHVKSYFHALVRNWNRADDLLRIVFVLVYSIPVIGYHFWYLLKSSRNVMVQRTLLTLDPLLFGAMLFMIIVNSGSSGSFIYFQF